MNKESEQWWKSLNFCLSIIFSFDFLLRKVKKCTCQWHVTLPVLYLHLCPGPFSMSGTTRAARHGPKSLGSIWRRALLPGEARKWPFGCFPGKPWGGWALWACQWTAGGTLASCTGNVPGTTGAHEQLSSPC